MPKKELHPSVQQFKEFVKSHPKIVLEVRKGNTTWQELFEEWYLLGEEDSRWDEFKEGGNSNTKGKEDKKEWIPQILGALQKMEPTQIQGHITNLSQALGAIQGVLSTFQGGNQISSKGQEQSNQPQHPFQFRKD